MGGLTRGLEINTFETASALAARLGAGCSYLAAPLYASSERSRDILIAQEVFRASFNDMAANDVALLSVGDMSRNSLLIRFGLPNDVTSASLKRAGAVGDIVGHFLDASGRPIEHPINKRVIAASPNTLAGIATVILASGGPHKSPIIAAVLRARLAHVLVCDEASAAEALQLYRPSVR
jgi:DNA-binding transcriptional regulator LsrR (DeoR family)